MVENKAGHYENLLKSSLHLTEEGINKDFRGKGTPGSKLFLSKEEANHPLTVSVIEAKQLRYATLSKEEQAAKDAADKKAADDAQKAADDKAAKEQKEADEAKEEAAKLKKESEEAKAKADKEQKEADAAKKAAESKKK